VQGDDELGFLIYEFQKRHFKVRKRTENKIFLRGVKKWQAILIL
jgi:hypothetical protein